jgi:RNA polymerase sigma-70 factor, ECF subfamily
VKGLWPLVPLAGEGMALPRSDQDTLPSAPTAPMDLDDVYRAHAGEVARWVGHLGGPTADVDDLVHEIFLVVERRLAEFRGDARLTTWLYRITEHVVRGRRRNDRIRRWLRRAWRGDVERALSPAPLTPIEDLERRRSTETVYRILDRLPHKYRDVLILFELEGASGEEIAELTGRKLATVWVHLHRARRLFLEALSDESGDDR